MNALILEDSVLLEISNLILGFIESVAKQSIINIIIESKFGSQKYCLPIKLKHIKIWFIKVTVRETIEKINPKWQWIGSYFKSNNITYVVSLQNYFGYCVNLCNQND